MASNKEMQLQRNCRLYAYVLSSLGKEIPEVVEECIESFEYVYNCSSELLAFLTTLDEQTFNTLLQAKNPQAQELRDWWNINKEATQLGNSLTKTCL